ncbi:hypothetical protein CROQUDRAFT_89630 [Cronartium quercuum f. sp. fusiforme G11]|uniref:HhH-GPD domain-containing protein n=1 Tax=Cronartium quercuum f. sp. fusiforme G11 TaxID=708437 RepID=A0A9P6NL49_9BASI|nr:hypothetical protein CROQUDRAFT_89630 [Cronartium quercuum f. sp. fusiforme G11]
MSSIKPKPFPLSNHLQTNAPTTNTTSSAKSPRSRSSSLTSLDSNSTDLKSERQVPSSITDSNEPKPLIRPFNHSSITPNAVGPTPRNIAPKQTTKARKTIKQSTTYNPSPFPDFFHPTSLESESVCAILSNLHGGRPERPKTLSSTEVSFGQSCGEVPDVLDALVRTILSQNTTNLNSTRAYTNLINHFRGANYNIIRTSDVKELADSIRVGGLADRKAKVIVQILNEIFIRGNGLISLDHLRFMSDDEVMNELVSFDGVGVKTAACVSMFCLGRNTFPVDTHVYRLSKALGWVPARANRDQTFYHLNQILPDQLKYALHILLIRHGTVCRQCSTFQSKIKTSSHHLKKKMKQGKKQEDQCPLKKFINEKS